MRWYECLCGCCVALIIATSADAVLITLDNIPATYDHSDEVPAATASGWRAIRPGTHTELILSAAGIVVTITRQTGAAFDVVDNDGVFLPDDPIEVFSQQGKSPAFGKRAIDPFFNQAPGTGFIFNFFDSENYQPESESNVPLEITGFSILVGDYGFDIDLISLQAYNGQNLTGGTVAGAFHQTQLPGTGNAVQWTQQRLRVTSAGGFESVLFNAVGGSNSFSVFFDRIAFVRGTDVLPPDSELDDPLNTGDSTVLIPEPGVVVLLAVAGVVSLFRRRRA